MHTRFSCFILVLTLAYPVFSQPPSAVPQPEVQVDFRLLAWSGSVWEIYRNPEKVELSSIGSHRPSEWFRHSGPLPIPLYKKGETVLGEDGIEVPRPVAFLQPPQPGKWLFLLVRDKDEMGRLFYQSFAVEDQSQELTKGYLFINLSDLDLMVRMNGELAQIKARGRSHLTPTPLADNTVDVMIAGKVGEEWKIKKTNTFSMPENGLTTVFVTQQGRNLTIRRFLDAKPPE